MAFVLGLPLIVLGLLALVLASTSEDAAGAAERLAAVLAELARDPADRAMLWLAAVLIPLAAALLVVQRRAWLRSAADGLEGYIPRLIGAGMLGQTTGRWRVRWEDVRRVRLVGAFRGRKAVQRIGQARLVVETDGGEVRIHPFFWFDPADRDHRLGLDEILPFREPDAVERLMSAPLPRAIAARGLEIDVDDVDREAAELRPSGFDLMRHKGMAAQLGLLFGAGLYGLGDTFLFQVYKPLGPLPVGGFVLAGVVAGIAVSRLGRGAPKPERYVVGALTVAVCIAAAYPATLRLNASTAQREILAYVSAGGGRFVPPAERLPPIDLSGENVAGYWAQYPPGAEHEFTVLRGAAGFYQLEMAPFYARTRQYFERRRELNDARLRGESGR